MKPVKLKDSGKKVTSKGPLGSLDVMDSDQFWVFNLCFSGFSLGMFLFWKTYMQAHPSELADKLFLVFACICGVSFVFLGLINIKFRRNSFHLLICLITLAVGTVVKENQNMSREHVMGFGLAVLILSIIVMFWFTRYLRSQSKVVFTVLILFVIYLVFISAISFYQDRNSLIESQHSEYVVNELLAPFTGKTLYQDFVPQYSFSLAFLFALAPNQSSYIGLIDFVVYSLTITAFLSLAIAIFLGGTLFKSKVHGTLLAVAVIVPLTNVTAGWSRTSYVGPPTTLLSGPSIRIFSGMILALVLHWILKQSRKSKSELSSTHSFFLGLTAGLSSSINLDFGIAASIAMLSTVFLLSINSKREAIVNFFSFVLSFSVFWIGLILLLKMRGAAPKPELFAWFIRQFGSGFGAVPISYPGPVMFALPTIFSLALFYAFNLARNTLLSSESDRINSISRLGVLTFVSIWTFLSLPYYLNRSYHSGQMSTLYLPLSLSILGLLGIVSQSLDKKQVLNSKNFIPLLLVSISVSSVWISPNPKIEINRIRNLNPDGELPRPEIRELISKSDYLKDQMKDKYSSYAYFGEEGNIVELATGIKSANIFNNPLDMFQSENSVKLGCEFLDQVRADALILTSNGAAAFAWNDGSLCYGKYKKTYKIDAFEIAERVKP